VRLARGTLRHIVCVFILCMAVFATVAQQLPSSQVFLRNAGTNIVSFAVSCDDRRSWQPIALKGQERQRFECDSTTAKMWGHINTDLPGESHQEVEIPLHSGSRYEVYFDQETRKWNFRST